MHSCLYIWYAVFLPHPFSYGTQASDKNRAVLVRFMIWISYLYNDLSRSSSLLTKPIENLSFYSFFLAWRHRQAYLIGGSGSTDAGSATGSKGTKQVRMLEGIPGEGATLLFLLLWSRQIGQRVVFVGMQLSLLTRQLCHWIPFPHGSLWSSRIEPWDAWPFRDMGPVSAILRHRPR